MCKIKGWILTIKVENEKQTFATLLIQSRHKQMFTIESLFPFPIYKNRAPLF